MSDLAGHFQMLARHAALLERIYRDGGVATDEESWRALSELQAARLVIEGDGEYRIASRFRAYLDDFFNRQRSYATATPLSVSIDALRRELADLHEAARRGDETGRYRSEGEAIDRIWQLREEIDEEVRVFDLITRNGYHNARSAEERVRRNAYYHKRAEELLMAIQALRGLELREVMAAPEMRDVRKAYRRQVLDRLEGWSTRLAGLIREMLDYLYRSREIAARTKRLRALLHAKRALPRALRRELIEGVPGPVSPIPMPLLTRPDLFSEAVSAEAPRVMARLDGRDQLAARARLRAAPPPIRPEGPEAGAAPPEAHPALTRFLAHLDRSAGPVSARAWAEGAGEPVGLLIILLHDHLVGSAEPFSWRLSPENGGSWTRLVEDILVEAADGSGAERDAA